MQISCTVTGPLIFKYAKIRFSHNMAHLMLDQEQSNWGLYHFCSGPSLKKNRFIRVAVHVDYLIYFTGLHDVCLTRFTVGYYQEQLLLPSEGVPWTDIQQGK